MSLVNIYKVDKKPRPQIDSKASHNIIPSGRYEWFAW